MSEACCWARYCLRHQGTTAASKAGTRLGAIQQTCAYCCVISERRSIPWYRMGLGLGWCVYTLCCVSRSQDGSCRPRCLANAAVTSS